MCQVIIRYQLAQMVLFQRCPLPKLNIYFWSWKKVLVSMLNFRPTSTVLAIRAQFVLKIRKKVGPVVMIKIRVLVPQNYITGLGLVTDLSRWFLLHYVEFSNRILY